MKPLANQDTARNLSRCIVEGISYWAQFFISRHSFDKKNAEKLCVTKGSTWRRT